MASEYNLALKATLDTSQVQQELQRLKQTYTVGADDGNSFSKGAPGAVHMQKIEVQLTKLNSAIAGLQRAVEQLARQQGKPISPSGPTSSSGLPIALKDSYNDAMKEWLGSAHYKKFNRILRKTVKDRSPAERNFLEARYGSIKGQDFAHNVMMNGGIPGFGSTSDYKKMI